MMAMDHSHRGKAELLRILKSREIAIDDLTDRLAAAEGLLRDVRGAMNAIDCCGDAATMKALANEWADRLDAHLRGETGR